jgi:hypothetical protein
MNAGKYNSYQIKHIFEKKLGVVFEKRKRSDHLKAKYVIPGKFTIMIVVQHGRKTINEKLYAKFAKELNMPIQFLDEFLDCINNKEEYLKLFQEASSKSSF